MEISFQLNIKTISRLKYLISFCHNNSNIVYIDKTIGGSDYEFDLEVKNKKQFLDIINELRDKFPEIRGWKYQTLKKYDKLLYFPRNNNTK